MKRTSSMSRFFNEARQTSKGSKHSPSETPTQPTPKTKPTVEEMEAANVRALRTRGRLAYSQPVMMRRRDEMGLTPSRAKRGEAMRPTLPIERVRTEWADWIRSNRLSGFSTRTIADRERTLVKFFWFIEREGYTAIGQQEIEAYLLHVRNGHLEPQGRFGTGGTAPKAFQPLRPNTYRYHWDVLAAFFGWQAKKGLWSESPFSKIEPAIVPEDTDIKPFTRAEIDLMLAATKRSFAPARDAAIIYFLWDTGVRASELCGITFADLDERTNAVTIRGKGNKRRTIYFGQKAGKALWKHINDIGVVHGDSARAKHAPVFASERGSRSGEALQPRSLLGLIHRLGKAAGVEKAHPHRFRHTFALNFLKNGGNQMSLMRLLGHTDLTMTSHYVSYSLADLEEQHRQFSPADGQS